MSRLAFGNVAYWHEAAGMKNDANVCC